MSYALNSAAINRPFEACESSHSMTPYVIRTTGATSHAFFPLTKPRRYRNAIMRKYNCSYVCRSGLRRSYRLVRQRRVTIEQRHAIEQTMR